MPPLLTRLKNLGQRRRRWLAVSAITVALYAALGFWAVPAIISSQVSGWARTELARQATLGEVSFNPFTLRLQARDLKLAEADGAPLFSIGELHVEMQWRSLVRRAWSFAEIRIADPKLSFLIDANGKFNLAELVATLNKRPHDPAVQAELPRLVIERFALERGQVDVHDKHAGYDNQLSPIDFQLAHFSTLPEQNDTHVFSASSPRGGTLRWKGSASVNPIRATGQFTLENISLPDLSVYLKHYSPAIIEAGRLSATVPYAFSYDEGKIDAKLAGVRVSLDDVAASIAGGANYAAVKARAGKVGLDLQLAASLSPNLQLKVSNAALQVTQLEVAQGTQPALQIEQLGFTQGSLDLPEQQVTLGRLFFEGGQVPVRRDADGRLNLSGLLPPGGEGKAPSSDAKPWNASIQTVELSRFDADVKDEGTGIALRATDIAATIEGAGTDLSRPIKFRTALSLREGGKLSAQGSIVPATTAMQADVAIAQIALAPVQPLLAKFVKLKLAKGHVSARGKLTVSPGAPTPSVRYQGDFQVADLRLDEDDGDLFASWKSVGAARLTASVAPDKLEIPELRVSGANAKLIIEDDRSLNAARLLVKSEAKAASAPSTGARFPVDIGRVRIADGKLDFTDLSLRPQFAAKIHELNGVVVGLSTRGESQSQIELDGRVDEFGSARIRGKLNPFALAANTDVGVVFKNVDMVTASPYSMKFAGYRIAEGKISLDLQYKVRANKLEGANQIVIDRLTLGERVDSPDAIKLPLELAIAILKDSDGRIDLGLPVTGDLSDPQFSYGAIIWKAIGNVLTKIVTAPFRALGSLLGIDGAKLEAIEFDPGNDTASPPEREKLKNVAQLLAKRAQLNLSVPGQYNEAADGAALRSRAVRIEVFHRTGAKPDPALDPGPLNFEDRATRNAIKELYASRFGEAELDKQKKAAEAAPASAASAPKLAVWQRVGKIVQGEPQVADASGFYGQLLERLYREQALAPDALTKLGARRAEAIVDAIRAGGVDASRVSSAAPEKIETAGKAVPVQLRLGAVGK